VWRFKPARGPVSEWTREGDHTLYVTGIAARITTATVNWKADSQLVRMGTPAAHNMLIKVELEDAEVRSGSTGPGPFGACRS
jgi:hypothetical protein